METGETDTGGEVSRVVLRFGPRFGSPAGRVMLDTLEFQVEPGVDPGCPA